jgi:1-deoxy-D-xylulose-5-phosphate reductoisomerase
MGQCEKIIDEFRPKMAAISHPASFMRLKKTAHGRTSILAGEEGILEMIESLDADTIVSAIVGSAGLLPTLASVRKGVRVAIANKEPMVMAGRLITRAAKKSGASLLPIDSEHSAVFQCLNGESDKRLKEIILTASGGPFLHTAYRELAKVTPAMALKHPKWKMGAKITIDSATLMNKGLEVIEARWLFGVPSEKIRVLIHPQSIVHSMVEFEDTSVMAQMGIPDMKVPIAYALSYPDRLPASQRRLDLVKEKKLEFFPTDTRRFPCLNLAYSALAKGGTMPAVLNAANEAAVEAFLEGKAGFLDIPRLVEQAMSGVSLRADSKLENIIKAHKEGGELVKTLL